jgi:hypothetical protein
MNIDARPCLAMLCPGDRSARDPSDPAASRFGNLFDAFASAGVSINSMLDSRQPNSCN